MSTQKQAQQTDEITRIANKYPDVAKNVVINTYNIIGNGKRTEEFLGKLLDLNRRYLNGDFGSIGKEPSFFDYLLRRAPINMCPASCKYGGKLGDLLREYAPPEPPKKIWREIVGWALVPLGGSYAYHMVQRTPSWIELDKAVQPIDFSKSRPENIVPRKSQ